MSGAIEWFTDPWSLLFMQRAFVVGIVAGVVCGVIGTYVVLRGMAFIGDAVSHAVFPGVAAAYVLGVNLLIGGAVAGVATAILIAAVSQFRRLREDTVIGVFFAFAFGLGIVLVSTQQSYTGDLTSFLFGEILALGNGDVATVLVLGTILAIAALVFRKELVAVSLDRETAAAAGLPVFRLDVFLYVLVTLAIVISLDAVGSILVLALLITPAATARLLTDRLTSMMLIAAGIGGAGPVAGLYLSYHLDLAAGGLIVLVLTTGFLLTWLLAPRHGLVARRRLRSQPPPAGPEPELVVSGTSL